MTNRRDHLVLGIAFVAALLLHAAALPFVGAAVGDFEPTSDQDWKLNLHCPSYAKAADQLAINWSSIEVSDSITEQDLPISRDARFMLSRDRVIDETDNELLRIKHGGQASVKDDLGYPNFRPGTFVNKVDLPADADGPYWIIGEEDVDRVLPDMNRSNNLRRMPIYIDGPQTPILTIDRFDTPERALPGGTIAIHYSVTNTGKGWANRDRRQARLDPLGLSLPVFDTTPNWIDRVYLSQDDRLDESDLPLRSFDRTAPLGPGDRYRHDRVALPMPAGIKGKAYLIIAADADQQLDQPSFTEGLVVKPIEFVDDSAPDLVVAEIEKIDRLVIGRPSPLTFEIANLGNATVTNLSSDAVYLSPEPVLDSRAILLDEMKTSEALEPRGRYKTTLPVTVPDSVEPGEWFLIVKADAPDWVDEPGFEDNNTLAVPITVLTQKQADAEIQLGSPDRPERLVVQWIEYDRVEEHIARLSRTVQPALQDKADPTPDAPLNFFPEPPSIARQPGNPAGNATNTPQPTDPNNNPQARPNPNATDASQTSQAPRPQQPGTTPTQRVDGLAGNEGNLPQQRPGIDKPMPIKPPAPNDPTPSKDGNPSPLPGDTRVESPADPNAPDTPSTTDSQTPSEIESPTDANNPDRSPSTTPTKQTKPVEADEQNDNNKTDKPVETPSEGEADQGKTKTTTPNPSEDAETQPEGKPDQPSESSEEKTPTRAPKDANEAPPTNNRKVEVELQEGKVLVGKGIKVITKLPTQPGTGARRLSLPRNARVSVTFDRKGRVHEAKILRSTTYKEWDAAIEASLYRWSAEGEAIDKAQPYITIEWDYILNELIGDEE